MATQYIFGNPTRKKKSRKKNPKNPMSTRYVAKDKKTGKVVDDVTSGEIYTPAEVKAMGKQIHVLTRQRRLIPNTKAGRPIKKRFDKIIHKAKTDRNTMVAVRKANKDDRSGLYNKYSKKGKRLSRTLNYSTPAKLESEIKKLMAQGNALTSKAPKKGKKKMAKKKRGGSKKKTTKKKTTRKKAAKKTTKKRRKKAAKKTSKKKTVRKKAAKKTTKKRRKTAAKKTTKKRRKKAAKKTTKKRGKKRGKKAGSKKGPLSASEKAYLKKHGISARGFAAGKTYSISKDFGGSITLKNPKKRRKNPMGKRRRRRSKNPMNLRAPMDIGPIRATGSYEKLEAASMVLGGGLYGTINYFVSKRLGAIGGLAGGTMGPLLVGYAAHYVNEKFLGQTRGSQQKPLGVFANGMIASALVGLGVVLGQKFLPTFGLDGVQYIPGGVKVPGSPGTDFGNVSLTPEQMGGVQFLPGQGHKHDFGDMGAGAYEQSEADFGDYPEGMGMGSLV